MNFENRQLTKAADLQHPSYAMGDPDGDPEILEDLNRLLVLAHQAKYPDARAKRPKRAAAEWKDKVNCKRAMARALLVSGPKRSLKSIAESVGCSRELVRTVRDQIALRGEVGVYDYNNQYTDRDLQELRDMIREPANKYLMAKDYKRVHGKFSVKRVRAELKLQGRKWKKMPRTRVKSIERVPDRDRMRKIISHITSALLSDNKEVLYADEMKFPLFQTPSFMWLDEQMGDEMYNNRQENVMLSAIVMCSRRGFEAAQFFTEEVTAVDFLYFMQEAIRELPWGKQYSVLVDNAAWHTAKVVVDSDVWRFLAFNEPGQFRVNLIENSFSGVRAMWRQRPEVGSLVGEAETLQRIFCDAGNEERFKGYYYNHIRAMLSYFQDY